MAYDQNKNVDIAFEAPLFESTKGLVGLMFQQVGKISDLIRDPSFSSTDGRLELMVNHLISAFIVDIDEQNQFRSDMQNLIDEYTKKATSNETRGEQRNKACMVFEGKVLARLHDLLGTTKRNRVGIVWDPEECKVVDFR